MANSKAVGVAYADPEFETCYATQELGYAASSQGNVTQLTSKTTGVALNTPAGRITLNNSALGVGATALFTLTNSTISPRDLLIVTVASGGTAGAYWAYVANLAQGVATIGVYNNTAGSLSESFVLNYAILHCQCVN